MRKFLQECADKDTAITDSLIRTRALDVAKSLYIAEDKFKASSGWVENFKHRHGIRGGKWIHGTKNVSVLNNPNPGLTGTSASALSYHLPAPPSTNESPMRSNRYDSPEIDNGPQWSGSSHRVLSLSTGAPSLPSPLSSSSNGSMDDLHVDDGDKMQDHATGYLQPPPNMMYAALPDPRGPPSLAEAETAMNTLLHFLDTCPQQIVEQTERELLTTIKFALFQYGSGVPFSRR